MSNGTNGWKQVGTVGVESGQLMIIDPYYVTGGFESSTKASEPNYQACLKATLSQRGFGGIGGSGRLALGFAMSTGGVDGGGEYPVFVRTDGRQVCEVRIVFVGSEVA